MNDVGGYSHIDIKWAGWKFNPWHKWIRDSDSDLDGVSGWRS